MIGFSLWDAQDNNDEDKRKNCKGYAHNFWSLDICKCSVIGPSEFRVWKLEGVSCRSIGNVIFSSDWSTREVYLDKATTKVNILHVLSHHNNIFGPADS